MTHPQELSSQIGLRFAGNNFLRIKEIKFVEIKGLAPKHYLLIYQETT